MGTIEDARAAVLNAAVKYVDATGIGITDASQELCAAVEQWRFAQAADDVEYIQVNGVVTLHARIDVEPDDDGDLNYSLRDIVLGEVEWHIDLDQGPAADHLSAEDNVLPARAEEDLLPILKESYQQAHPRPVQGGPPMKRVFHIELVVRDDDRVEEEERKDEYEYWVSQIDNAIHNITRNYENQRDHDGVDYRGIDLTTIDIRRTNE
jgi:hypothetical protein